MHFPASKQIVNYANTVSSSCLNKLASRKIQAINSVRTQKEELMNFESSSVSSLEIFKAEEISH